MSQSLDFLHALSRAKKLLNESDNRIIIGIVGKPGAGKSRLSSYLMENLSSDVTSLLPMDGYHLSNKILVELGRADRKGAPDTFDSFGFAELLETVHLNQVIFEQISICIIEYAFPWMFSFSAMS